MDPSQIPEDRRHLHDDERHRMMCLELLVDQGKFAEAQEMAEDLWLESTDAHKRLFQGISNALTAVVARQARQRRGARQISEQTRAMLAPFPRRVIGIELDALLDSVNDFVTRGEGPVLLRRQGA